MFNYISERVEIWTLIKYVCILAISAGIVAVRLIYGSSFVCFHANGPQQPLSCLMLYLVMPLLSLSMIGYGFYEVVAYTGRVNEDKIIAKLDGVGQYRHILQYYPFYYVLTLLIILSALIWTEIMLEITYRSTLWGLVFDGIGAIVIAESFSNKLGSNPREDSRIFWGFLFLVFGFGIQAWVAVPWNELSAQLVGS